LPERPPGAARGRGVDLARHTLSRDLLDSGGFAGLIADCAVTGATSNPTIFAKVITDAYLTGLERRVAAGHPVDANSSVASFFVSRVDAKTERRARARTRPRLLRLLSPAARLASRQSSGRHSSPERVQTNAQRIASGQDAA
jgi:transaldolase